MKKISSKMTLYYKRILPAMLFGVILLATLVAAADKNSAGEFIGLIVGTLFVGGIMFFVCRELSFNVADEVYDCGDYLLIKKGGSELRIRLDEIINVHFAPSRPPRLSLLLEKETPLGTEISFFPPTVFSPGKPPPVARDLILRTEQARSRKTA